MERETYYVAIGASAGGLEAIELFFKNIPSNTGMIFFVIQHLSPDYKSLMNELLARFTDMNILVAEDGMQTEANNVYLIPPRHSMSIYHGKLYLEEQVPAKYQLFLPIDMFFKSLATDQEKNAVGIILSGTGGDGSIGIKSIKEMGGMIMVQSEDSAKFDGMPKNAIATGLADYILSPQQMPDVLIDYVMHPSLEDRIAIEKNQFNDADDIGKICMIMRNYAEIDFLNYKENTLIRRIERRIKITRMPSIREYIQELVQSDKEKETLLKELLIGVTDFFRDSDAFEGIRDKILPNLDYSKGTIRIWSAGCSTGEEVYSMAILINEYLEQNQLGCEIKIFATDVDAASLETAGLGYYPSSLTSSIPPEILTKYFHKYEDGFQIIERLRKQIVFAKHNILSDPPFSRLDLLICRNLFIYLKPEYQQQVLADFYYSLNQGGYLFLGSSESLGEMESAFDKVDSKWKIYRYKEGYRGDYFRGFAIDKHRHIQNFEQEQLKQNKGIWYEQMLVQALENVVQPSVIIDTNENIIQIIGNVSEFFTIQSGRFTNKLSGNINRELSLYFSNIIRRLHTERKTVVLHNIKISSLSDTVLSLRGILLEMGDRELYLITIEKNQITEDSEVLSIDMNLISHERVKQLELELQLARESLQATIEELETSNEELQSSNEELIASNEELQSTNEELQSVNEELYTVNNEHQQKIEQLTNMTNDLNNLLKNTEVGALYLDKRLCIRRLTPIVTKVTNIRENDIGRPIDHLKAINGYRELAEDAQSVIETLDGIEKTICDEEQRYWLIRFRPYRSEYNSVEGVIMTMVEVTRLHEEQKNVRQLETRLDSTMIAGSSAWWEYNVDTGLVVYSDRKATMLGYSTTEFPTNVYEICSYIHPEDYERTMQSMRDYMTGASNEWDIVYRMKCKNGTYKNIHDVGHVTEWTMEGKIKKIVGAVTDLTKLIDIVGSGN